jgi:hypothetical protein
MVCEKMYEWNKKSQKRIQGLKISRIIAFLLLLMMFGSILFSHMGIPYANGEITEFNQKSPTGTRSNKNFYLESAKLVGAFSNDIAMFHLNITFYVNVNNTLVMIPLIGPPTNAMVKNLSINNLKSEVRFNSDYYYFTETLFKGHYYLDFNFSSKLFAEGKIDLNFTLYGSILNYLIEFTIPLIPNENIHIIDLNKGKIIEKTDQIIINWEYYAANTINWNLEWIKFKLPTPNDINCDINAEVFITDKKARIEVDYSLEFFGFALEKIEFSLDSQTIIISSDKGTIESFSKKAIIDLNSLIYGKIKLKLIFEKKFNNDLKITIPRPLMLLLI